LEIQNDSSPLRDEFDHLDGDALFLAVHGDHVVALVELDRAFLGTAEMFHHVVDVFAHRARVIAPGVHHQRGLRDTRQHRLHHRA